MPLPTYDIPSQEILPNVLKVLDLIVMNVPPQGKRNAKQIQDVYSCAASAKCSPCLGNVRSIGKRCVDLTNKSICSHRFEEAAKLVWILCQDKSVFDIYLFKAAMFVLENLDFEDKDRIIRDFLKEAQKLWLTNKREVQLEYIIYGLKNNVTDIQENAQILIPSKQATALTKNEILDPILEAYDTFPYYNAWWYDANGGELQLSKAKVSAKQAILKFEKVITRPGDWDIFVLNLIEMLNFSDRSDEIEDVLLNYVECNPNNLNAHIYLCSYLCKYAPSSEKLIHHLKVIAKLSPSDERLLWLLEKWSKLEKKLEKCLKLVFFFLDYPSNGKNVQAWKMLSEFLLQVKYRNKIQDLERVLLLWNSRCKSWNYLYFNPSHVCHLKETDSELIAVKINVISFFDKNHVYIKEVMKKFPTIRN